MTIAEMRQEVKRRKHVLAALTMDYQMLRADLKQAEIEANCRQPTASDEYLEQFEYSDELKALAKILQNKLSMRRIQILYLLTQGHSNIAIGEIICIADKTVRFHLTAIFKVLNVKSRLEAALKAKELLTSI